MKVPSKDPWRLVLVVPSFVLFWVMGLGFLWWLVVPLLLLLSTIRQGERTKPAYEAMVLGIIALWLTMTIFAGLMTGEIPFSRVPGAAFAIIVWSAASLLFQALQRLTPEQNFHFIRGLIFTGAMQGFLTFVAVSLHPSPLSSIRFASASLIGNSSGGVTPWTVANLAYTDYFGGGIVRSSGLMATAAWSGGFACLVLILLLAARKQLLEAGLKRRWWLVAAALNLASLYYSYSRVSWAILILVVAGFFFFRWMTRAAPGGFWFASTLSLIGGAVALILLPWQEFILEQDSLRPGSSQTRRSSYVEGFEAAGDEGPIAFFAGAGVKPFIEGLDRGAGSESTYLSLLVRGGLVALVLLTMFFVGRLTRARTSFDGVSAALLVALAIHAVVEDLDVGTLTLLLVLIEPLRISGQESQTSSTVTSPESSLRVSPAAVLRNTRS